MQRHPVADRIVIKRRDDGDLQVRVVPGLFGFKQCSENVGGWGSGRLLHSSVPARA